MSNTLHIIAIWAHILGIALFVGPQFFLALAWVPVSRGIADQATRVDLTAKLTKRFGWIGGAGLLLIVVAGSYLISDWRDFYSYPDEAGFTDIRYGVLFIVKMSLFIVMLAVVAGHTFLVGPRLVEKLQDQLVRKATDDDVRRARMASRAFSMVGLTLALAIMVLGVMMNTTNFSFRAS